MRRQGVTIMTFRLFISVNSSPSSLPHSEYRSKMELPSFPVYIFSVQPVTIACVLTSPGTSFLPMLLDNACSLFYSWIMYHHISEGLQKILQSRSTRPIVVIYGKKTNKQKKTHHNHPKDSPIKELSPFWAGVPFPRFPIIWVKSLISLLLWPVGRNGMHHSQVQMFKKWLSSNILKPNTEIERPYRMADEEDG